MYAQHMDYIDRDTIKGAKSGVLISNSVLDH